MKINTLSPDKHKFLQISTTVAKPPKKLYCIGNLPKERRPTVAIVGSRKPTRYGKEVTERLAYDLAKQGIIIISGLAIGVDGIAHTTALEAGGTTIAVLGNGLSYIYPTNHADLARRIVEQGGAILSEYEPHVLARGYQFLERNRLVSAFSDAVIITEAAARSGTLNTASHAIEQNKELFVVPGNITSPLSTGCNSLLRQGATPITCAEDVIEVIAPELLRNQSVMPLGDTPEEATILKLIHSGIRDGDELQIKSKLDPVVFSQTLTMLEINGAIKPLGGNQWTLR